MKSKVHFVVLLIGCLCLTGFTVAQQSQTASGEATANGAVPNLIKYSGVLKDASGSAITGLSGVTFLIYKDEQGGAPLWMETQNLQPDKTGRYTVQLGAASKGGLPPEVFITGDARWLAVQVGGEAEQARVSLVAVPYAMKAADAQTLGGLPASAFMLAPASGSNSAASSAQSDSGSSTTPPPPSSSTVTTTGGVANTIPMFTTATNIQNSILTQAGTSAINVAGKLNLPATGPATTTAGKNSQPIALTASSFDSATKAPVAQTFEWQAEPAGNNSATPSGTLNLLYGGGGGAPKETGLKISNTGIFNFASGQTFPGTGTITGVTTATGSGLTGGATNGTANLSLTNSCSANQVLQWNGSAWNCSSSGTGTVTSVATGAGLTGGPITSTGTISIPNLGVTNAMLQNSSLNVNTGSGLLGGGPVSLGGSISLNLDPSKVPLLTANNKFTGNETVAGNITASNIGIGTTAPGAELDVFSSTFGVHTPMAQFGSNGISDSNDIRVYNGLDVAEIFMAGGIGNFVPGTRAGDGGIRVNPGFNIFFGDSGLSRMELTSAGNALIAGNVGIGTSAPTFPLHVIGTMRSETGLSLSSSATLSVDAPFNPGGNFIVQPNGNVGIGTNTPTFPLHVQGTMRSETGLSLGGNAVLSVDAPGKPNGRLQVNSNGVSIGGDTPMNSNPHMSFSGMFVGSLCGSINCGFGLGLPWGAFVPDKTIVITRITATINDAIDPSCLPGKVGVFQPGINAGSNPIVTASLPANSNFLDSQIIPPAPIAAGTQLFVGARLDNFNNPGNCNVGASAGGNLWINVQYVMQ